MEKFVALNASNLSSGSLLPIGFSSPCRKSALSLQRRRVHVTRASVALEQQAQTKVAVIRVGTRGRYCQLFTQSICTKIPNGLYLSLKLQSFN